MTHDPDRPARTGPNPVKTLKTLMFAAALATLIATVNLIGIGQGSTRPLAILLIVILGLFAIGAGLIARQVRLMLDLAARGERAGDDA